MELNIVNREAGSLHGSFGITDERANELGRQMDEMVKKYKGRMVATCDVFNEIAGLCNSTEEMVFCSVSHTCWVQHNFGVLLCPPSAKISLN